MSARIPVGKVSVGDVLVAADGQEFTVQHIKRLFAAYRFTFTSKGGTTSRAVALAEQYATVKGAAS